MDHTRVQSSAIVDSEVLCGSMLCKGCVKYILCIGVRLLQFSVIVHSLTIFVVQCDSLVLSTRPNL